MNDIAIRVDRLSKQYRLGKQERYLSLRDSLTEACLAPFRRLASLLRGSPAETRGNSNNHIWALKDVSFEVKRGEVVGIIGRNGAGKSTLLKVLSRITEPTEGFAEIRGRVGSLLEVGTGFHPELTGRENIYLNGAILGMRKAEIASKFDEIVAFAEVEKFLDTPVKHYSSGMYLRLAFAVAAHLEPEILLVDEVLAVGDAAFQKKCLGKMDDVAKEGRTVLFVSHNMAAVQNLCNKVIFLDNGKISFIGPTDSSIMEYISSIQNDAYIALESRLDRKGNGALRFKNYYVLSPGRGVTDNLQTGETATFVLEYESNNSNFLENVSVSIAFYNRLGQHLFMFWTKITGQNFSKIAPKGEFLASIRKFPLMPGRYSINLYCEVNGILADWVVNAATLNVVEGDFFGTGYLSPNVHGGVVVEHDWECHSKIEKI
jgi:lipopolysaccharide transport system ATP-binding protein